MVRAQTGPRLRPVARESVTTVEDKDLGSLKMQNVFPRMSRTPGRIKHAGPRIGEHQAEVIGELERAGKITPEVARHLIEALAKPAKK